MYLLATSKSCRFGNTNRILKYTVVLRGVVISSGCNICSPCFVQRDVDVYGCEAQNTINIQSANSLARSGRMPFCAQYSSVLSPCS